MTSAFLTLTSKVTDVEVTAFSECFSFHLILKMNERKHKQSFVLFCGLQSTILQFFMGFFIPPRNRGGVIFSLQFVCLSFCVSGSACEQNSNIHITKETCQKFTYSPQLANLTATVYSTWNQAQALT